MENGILWITVLIESVLMKIAESFWLIVTAVLTGVPVTAYEKSALSFCLSIRTLMILGEQTLTDAHALSVVMFTDWLSIETEVTFPAVTIWANTGWQKHAEISSRQAIRILVIMGS